MDTQEEKERKIINKYYELSKTSKELYDKLKTLTNKDEIDYTFQLIRMIEQDFIRLLYI